MAFHPDQLVNALIGQANSQGRLPANFGDRFRGQTTPFTGGGLPSQATPGAFPGRAPAPFAGGFPGQGSAQLPTPFQNGAIPGRAAPPGLFGVLPRATPAPAPSALQRPALAPILPNATPSVANVLRQGAVPAATPALPTAVNPVAAPQRLADTRAFGTPLAARASAGRRF